MNALANVTVTEWVLIGSGILFGAAVFLLVRSLFPESFLREIKERADRERDAPQVGPVRGATRRRPSPMRAFGGALVEKIGAYNDRFVKPAWSHKMHRRFTAMGRPEYRPQDFIAQQQIYAAFFGALGLLLFNLIDQPLWYSIPFFVLGFFFPYIWLRDQISKRHKAISRELPYNIDLLTLAVEAGLDFGGALQTVVEKGQPGPLVEELNILISEMKLGKTREEALRNFADRVQLLEVSTFVSNLVQADKMGTSMGRVLRIQSVQLRIARAQRAEKLANEAPVKMLFPLIFCFFPTVFMILFGPIIYRLVYGGGIMGG